MLARGRPVQLLGHRGEWVGEGEDAISLDEVPELDSFVALWGKQPKGGGVSDRIDGGGWKRERRRVCVRANGERFANVVTEKEREDRRQKGRERGEDRQEMKDEIGWRDGKVQAADSQRKTT